MKKILFISHDASQTGAPILLLQLIKWLVQNKKKEFEICLLLGKGGPLENEFLKLIPTVVLFKNKKKNIVQKGIQKIFIQNPLKHFKNKQWDLVFSNTIVNGKILEQLDLKNTATISYIHELEYSIQEFLQLGLAQGTFDCTNLFLCGSKLVQETLINNFNVKEDMTQVVYSFQDIEALEKEPKLSLQLKKALEIPLDAKIVAMAGSFIWRKGFDFFVNTATLLQNENIYFIWIGFNNKRELNKITYDLNRKNCQPKIKYIAPSPDYKKYFNCIDIFFLSSREDPYPMVMLDATCYGLPILCFKNAGGTQEFIDDKVGVVLPYGDCNEAASIIKTMCDANDLKKNKKYIQQKSLKIHDVNKQAPKIYHTILEQMNTYKK